VHARVDIVGMGLAAGHATHAGMHALAACGWVGHHGLPLAVREHLCGLHPAACDLDLSLDSRQPHGFVERLAAALQQMSSRFGRVALAVSGHPAVANPATACLMTQLNAAGVPVTLYGAPTALDHFMAATGVDLVERCVSLVDARRWLAQANDAAGRALAVWNAGYLSPAEQLQLLARLGHRYAPSHPVQLFRVVGERPWLRAWPLQPASAWLAALDAETTLFIF
jgi:hypothetical protein